MGSRVLRKRLRIAIDHGVVSRIVGPTIFASDWRELAQLTELHGRSPAVVDLSFQSATDRPEADSVRVLQGVSAPLVSYSRQNGGRTTTTPGIRFVAVLRPSVDDSVPAIAAAVLRAAGGHAVTRLLCDIARRANGDVERIFVVVLALAVRRCTVPELAASLARSPRSLRRDCAALGLPPPKKLLSLGRIFTVERLAEWSGQPSGAVALALGFSDYANYRRLVRHTLVDELSPLTQRIDVDDVHRVILQALAPGREQFPVRLADGDGGEDA